MKKLLTFLLLFLSFGAFAQTYDTLPVGSKPYGNQLYLTSDGLIIGGTGSAKFRVIGTKKYIDSLFAAATIADATATIKGKLKLAGDLSGTADLPTVPGLAQKVDKISGKGLSTEDYSSAEKSKLGNIAAGATANSTDATLLNRANHTGTQAISTVSGLQTALDSKANTSALTTKADLVSGKVPTAQLPDAILGSVSYQGNYDASTNTPTLPAASGNKGKYYVVEVAGVQQGFNFNLGDWVISNGAIWQKVDNNNNVTSVAGKVGAVSLVKADVGLANVDNTSDANKPISTATQTALNAKANLTGGNSFTGLQNVSGNIIANAATASNHVVVKSQLDAVSLTPGPKGDKGDTGNTGATGATGPAGSDATVPDATTSIKGKIKLAGDLGGTADLPTVPALATKANSNGSNATGTWGINTTGNAATATNTTQWNGYDLNTGSYGSSLSNLYGQEGTVFKPYNLSQIKSALATSLQDVTSVGNTTTSPLIKKTLPSELTSTLIGYSPQGYTAIPSYIGTVNHEANWYGASGLTFFTSQSSDITANLPTEKMRILGDGNVGIGTTAPTAKLDVNGNVKANGVVTIGDNNTAGVGFLQLTPSSSTLPKIQSALAGVGVTNLAINPDGGNVGIGTTTPTAKLDVAGTIKATTYNGGAILTGAPTAPTAAAGTNTTQIATTAFVKNEITTVTGLASGTYTPSVSNVSLNVSSTSSYNTSNYIKVGNVVLVTGAFSFNISSTGNSSFAISLPFSSTTGNVVGTATCFQYGTGAPFSADLSTSFIGGNRFAGLNIINTTGGTGYTIYYSFSYLIN